MDKDDFDPNALFPGLQALEPLINQEPFTPDDEWFEEVQRRNELADEANQRVIEMARLLAELQESQRLQAAEYARKEAEQVAREEHALELAAKSHREARLARIIAVWAVVVALLAIVVPLILH